MLKCHILFANESQKQLIPTVCFTEVKYKENPGWDSLPLSREGIVQPTYVHSRSGPGEQCVPSVDCHWIRKTSSFKLKGTLLTLFSLKHTHTHKHQLCHHLTWIKVHHSLYGRQTNFKFTFTSVLFLILLILILLIITTLWSFMCFSDIRALAGSTPHLHEDPNPIKKQKRLSKKDQKENGFSGAAAIMGVHIYIYIFFVILGYFSFHCMWVFFPWNLLLICSGHVEISLLIKSVLLTI